MKRFLFIVAVVLLGFLLQNNVFALISFVRTTPNILLVITCSFGFIRGRREGMFVGLFSGLLIECVFGGTMGFYMLIYVYLGYFSGIWHKYFDVENIIMPSLLCGISDLFYGLYIFVVRFALRNRLDLGFYFRTIILPEVLYTVVIALIVFGILLMANRKLEQLEKRRAAKFV
jgi:rod shape-determining protein MreD